MALRFLFSPIDVKFHFVIAPAGAAIDPGTLVDNFLTQEGDDLLTQDGSFLLTQG